MTFCRKGSAINASRFQNVQNKQGTAAGQIDILENGPLL
jgi:hypothetical protein